MSDGAHLLIPFAASDGPRCRQALAGLRLPRVERLLARLQPQPHDRGDANSLSMPHERALARLYGLPVQDGLLPFAAWESGDTSGQPAGWVTPCHWRVGADHVFMHPPQDLQLDAQESQALLAAMQPYFGEDGLQLAYEAPTRWQARGALLAQWPCASLDRVVGRVIDSWMPRGDRGKPLRRLQQEMQMLLYTHPVNEARERGGQLTVNSFWVSGNGALPAGAVPHHVEGLHVTPSLRHPALQDDGPAWAAAWQALDEREFAQLEQAQSHGQRVAVTLCGEHHARTWHSEGGGWLSRLFLPFGRKPAAHWLSDL